ncbi:uncharacterized protein LOC142908522 [Petromyzon marinus]|uniref:uncharacterized protein LOC142908522 n=1 Tax=Petromyzon marinus TaxID=7757 RepID=UPI003F72FF53
MMKTPMRDSSVPSRDSVRTRACQNGAVGGKEHGDGGAQERHTEHEVRAGVERQQSGARGQLPYAVPAQGGQSAQQSRQEPAGALSFTHSSLFTHTSLLHPQLSPSPTALSFTHSSLLHPQLPPSPTASSFTHSSLSHPSPPPQLHRYSPSPRRLLLLLASGWLLSALLGALPSLSPLLHPQLSPLSFTHSSLPSPSPTALSSLLHPQLSPLPPSPTALSFTHSSLLHPQLSPSPTPLSFTHSSLLHPQLSLSPLSPLSAAPPLLPVAPPPPVAPRLRLAPVGSAGRSARPGLELRRGAGLVLHSAAALRPLVPRVQCGAPERHHRRAPCLLRRRSDTRLPREGPPADGVFTHKGPTCPHAVPARHAAVSHRSLHHVLVSAVRSAADGRRLYRDS